MDLPKLWEIFSRYDRRGNSTASRKDLVGLLIDVGLCPVKPQAGCEKMANVNMLVDAYAKEETEFPLFLKIMHKLRLKSKTAVQEELVERFHSYDKDKSGQLHYSEVYQILADFKMLPKSR